MKLYNYYNTQAIDVEESDKIYFAIVDSEPVIFES